jgi:hypothetical protein
MKCALCEDCGCVDRACGAVADFLTKFKKNNSGPSRGACPGGGKAFDMA